MDVFSAACIFFLSCWFDKNGDGMTNADLTAPKPLKASLRLHELKVPRLMLLIFIIQMLLITLIILSFPA